MSRPDHTPSGNIAGVVAIAATYVYFLLYAQFGFVSYLKQFFADPLYTKEAMGYMGMGGLLFSFVAAKLLRTHSPRNMMAIAFSGCAASAMMTLTGSSQALFFAAAFFIGGFTGLLTVTLASGLRNWISGEHFGLHVGAGTGLAYLICNIPPVFDATPAIQTIFSAIMCLIGLVVSLLPPSGSDRHGNQAPIFPPDEFSGAGFVSIVLMLFALVWLDSSAFATIQLNESLRSHTWGTPGMKMMLGVFHALSAIAAGWLIDRGWLRGLLAVTYGLFVMAFTLLQSHSLASWLAGPLYAFGISIYSTTLVAYPTLHPEKAGLVPVRWRAAILFAAAGWLGSGLGVGLAQNLHSIPGYLMLIGGILIGGGLLFPLRSGSKTILSRYAIVFVAGLAGCIYFTWAPTHDFVPDSAPSIMLGRETYRQEGCINCHSQFLRPHSPDILLWGPYRAIDRDERPPMVGNRRQGPDLMNAGLRRSEAWHRQHLIDPASLSPGSKMPSYSYLFREGDLRGPSLVMYLSSLGISNIQARLDTINQWTPISRRDHPSLQNGKQVFEMYCFMCHGRGGEGDGPLATLFARPAMQLTKGDFVYVPGGLDNGERVAALSRIVKFGLIGLNMPGHEYFNDQDILDVVGYVRLLTNDSKSGE
jgi:cytochrome c oxidase cbb3-type subunit 2